MRRRGKTVKTQRHKTLTRRNAPAEARARSNGQETNVARELHEAREQQMATAEILRVIRTSPNDVQPVFETIVRNAVSLCGGLFANVFRFDGELLHYVASHNVGPSYADILRAKYPMRPDSSQVSGRVVLTKSVVWLEDALTDPDYDQRFPVAMGWRRLLGVPMLREGEPIGVIGVGWAEPGPISKIQEELLKTFADQAVIAIENTRLLNELRESLQQQTATADVLKVISRSTFDLQTVLDTLLESAVYLCEARLGALFRLEGDLLHVAAQHNFDDRQRKLLLAKYPMPPNRGHMSGRAVLTGAAIQIPDILADNDYRSAEAKEAGFRSLLGVPLLRNGQAIGSIVIFRTEVGPFTDKQLELLQTFADQAVIAIENTRLLNELRQRTDDLSEALEQQTATSEVLSVISSSPGELKPVFESMLGNAMRICEAQCGFIYRMEGGVMRAMAEIGVPPALAEYRRNYPHTGGATTPVDLMRATKKPAHVHDARESDAYRTGNPNAVAGVDLGGARTVLYVPMLKENEILGVINVYRQEVRPFADDQIALLENFAAQAVIAIENTRLLNELRESLQQQTATADVLEVISRSPGDLEPVFNAMLANATRICDASYGAMWLREGNEFRNAAFHGALPRAYTEQWQSGFNPGSYSPLTLVSHSRKPLQVADMREDRAYRDGHPLAVAGCDIAGIRTLVCVPMLKDNEFVGAIAIYRKEVRPFTDKQIELLANFAAQAVIAIENTRLLSELRESLQQQTATADVLKVISRSTFDLRTVLDTLVKSAVRLCRAEKGNVALLRSDTIEYIAQDGFPPDFLEYMKALHLNVQCGSVSGRAALEGKIIHVPDVLADPEFVLLDAQKVGGFRSALGVPLMREGMPIGTMFLARAMVEPFTQQQIDLVSTFADQAVIAIENVRLFESVETRTRELAASLENLRTTQDRLVQTQKLASLGQLTAGIAHEIKNPLNFVNNFSGVSAELVDELREALKEASFNETSRSEITELMDTLRSNLEKVVEHGKRADAIVKNMLVHSHQGSGAHRPVAINALVEESLKLAYHGARAEKQNFNIMVEQSLDPAAGKVDIFPQEITRVLLNLISNGVYATRDKAPSDSEIYKPTLTASTKSLGDCVEIRIRDNGIGITPEVKDKMFNPFFTTKPAGEGTGLGLSISHDIIVKQHGGSIEVDTQPGEFTEVGIILPRVAAISK